MNENIIVNLIWATFLAVVIVWVAYLVYRNDIKSMEFKNKRLDFADKHPEIIRLIEEGKL